MVDMDFHNYDEMSVEQLATIRDYGLERLQKVTEAMKTRIREEYAQGVSVKRLARSAGVTRRTIYLWVK
jgi:transposase-like protein